MWLWNEFWCLSWHGVYTICIYSCADPEGGGGSGPPPGKVQKYMVSLKLFLAILARTPLKSQSYQSSIQCSVLIGPPAKRHLNGVSLAGHWWPVNSGIWILPRLIKLKKNNKKRQSWTPSESTSWIRACLFSCPMMGIIISFLSISMMSVIQRTHAHINPVIKL